MRRLFILLGLAFIPCLASAQEIYTVNANANQVARLTRSAWRANAITCLNHTLPIGCTQTQACVSVGLPSGCTPAQARGGNVRIWPATQAGREEFVIFFMILPVFKALEKDDAGFDSQQFCVAWPSLSQATKDGICTAAGLTAGCELCVSTEF